MATELRRVKLNRNRVLRHVDTKRIIQNRLVRFGKPVQLFKDSDRDGVANVFDCQPFNRRRQDKVVLSVGYPEMREYGEGKSIKQIRDKQVPGGKIRKVKGGWEIEGDID